MSVLIRGMKMPKNCKECAIEQVDEDCIHYWCPLLQKNTSNYYRKRLPHCPLIELPPHGRLIDADNLYKQVTKFTGSPHWVAIEIKQAPTIIEEEGEA